VRIRGVTGRQASRPLLISFKVRRMLRRTFGLYKLMSKLVVHRISMKLEKMGLSADQGAVYS